MRRPPRLLPTIAAAALLAGCGTSPEAHYAKAQERFAAQDYDAARVELAAALHERPRDLAMLALLAKAQLRLGDPDGAMMTIGRLRGAGANGPAVMRFEAEARLLAGKPQDALGLLGSDASSDAWRLRARAHLALGHPASAIVAFERGVAAGNDVRLLADYVWFHVSANDLPAADALLKRLQGFAPKAMETLIVAGDLAVRQGRIDSALADYRRAAQLYPSRFQPLVSEAELHERLGQLDAAAKAADAADAVEPGHPVIATIKLRLAAKRGKWRDVRGALQGREDRLDPQSAEGQLYAEALLRLGQPEQARTILGRTLVMQPGNRQARLLLGEALLAGGDAAGAFDTLAPLAEGLFVEPQELAMAEKAARAAGRPEADRWAAQLRSPEFRRRGEAASAAALAIQRGDWAAAAEAYRTLAPGTDDPVVLVNLAYATSKAGRAAEAVAIADRALALVPGDPQMLKTAALARLDAGRDRDAAARLLRAARAADPADPETALLLRRAGG